VELLLEESEVELLELLWLVELLLDDREVELLLEDSEVDEEELLWLVELLEEDCEVELDELL